MPGESNPPGSHRSQQATRHVAVNATSSFASTASRTVPKLDSGPKQNTPQPAGSTSASELPTITIISFSVELRSESCQKLWRFCRFLREWPPVPMTGKDGFIPETTTAIWRGRHPLKEIVAIAYWIISPLGPDLLGWLAGRASRIRRFGRDRRCMTFERSQADRIAAGLYQAAQRLA